MIKIESPWINKRWVCERNVTKREENFLFPFSMTGAFEISMNPGLLDGNHDNDDDVDPSRK